MIRTPREAKFGTNELGTLFKRTHGDEGGPIRKNGRRNPCPALKRSTQHASPDESRAPHGPTSGLAIDLSRFDDSNWR